MIISGTFMNLRNLTNHEVKLVSLSTWRQANEIVPRDSHGPYIVMQTGYDPQDKKRISEEFVLGRSGKWLSLRNFYQMPLAERRSEFIFGTVSEVVQMMNKLPSKAELIRPAGTANNAPCVPAEDDEMAAALQAGRAMQTGTARRLL